MLDAMDPRQFTAFTALCPVLGPASVKALVNLLLADGNESARTRAIETISAFGPAAIRFLGALLGDRPWFVRRNLAQILGRVGSAEAVRHLQPLLRVADRRVLDEAVSALASIDDPSAARALQEFLRSASTDDRRLVVKVVVARRERRTVPMLVQILEESQPLGSDHTIVLETLGALEELGDERAIPAVVNVMHQRRWFARAKTRALKQSAIAALLKIQSPQASEALREAGHSRDRLLRNLAREMAVAR